MISVIIPVIDQLNFTVDLFESISKNTILPQEIILLDNNSSEDMFSIVNKFSNLNILYVRNYKKGKVNESWNRGISLSSNDLVAVLNNDIIVEKFFFEKIINIMSDEKIGFYSAESDPNISCVKNQLSNISEIKEPDVRNGCAFVVRKHIVESFGNIPKQLVTFCGDDYLYLKIRKLGYKTVSDKNNLVFHYLHQTLNLWKPNQELVNDFYYEMHLLRKIRIDEELEMIYWEDKSKSFKKEEMIYDVFHFMNEFHILDIRLNELNDVVDKFVLIESPKTFSMIDKPLYFNDNKDKYKEFLHKIIHVIYEPPAKEDPWVIYANSLNNVMNYLTDCSPYDIIMISDLDEIPRKHLLSKYVRPSLLAGTDENFFQIQQQTSYYYLNCLADHEWYGTVIVSYNGLKQYSPNAFRNFRGSPDFGIKVPDGGWHFTYLNTVEEIQRKIKSFTHQEFNTEEYTNLLKISQRMEKGLWPFDDNRQLKFIPFNSLIMPNYIIENIDKYSMYIKNV